ncbi:hypothetical protein TorRG33x02_004960 [Trema orientale]|uniref:Uncharacterized protein n=1 Tax=Trema orientale TaxID=63057 RepID=A0A2P5G2D7_TREOI|nr:hypothetical protein TorRG33x02_004960 [Trema orientale]
MNNWRLTNEGRRQWLFPVRPIIIGGGAIDNISNMVELASLNLLGHDVGGGSGANAGRSGRIKMVEREVPDGSAGGGEDVDVVVAAVVVGVVVVVVLVLAVKCHGISWPPGSTRSLALALSLEFRGERES